MLIHGKDRPLIANIISGNEDPVNLKKCLDSITPIVDKVILGFNGDNQELIYLLNSYKNVEWFNQVWKGDITSARVEVYDKTPDDAFVIWLDSDDEIINTDQFKEYCEYVLNQPGVIAIGCEWLYCHDMEGNCVAKLWRERVVEKKTHKWSSDFCHQILDQTADGTMAINDEWKVRHWATMEKIRWASIRNLNMILKQYNTEKKAGKIRGKTIYDLARTYQGVGKHDKALELYLEYIGLPDTPDLEKTITKTTLSEIYRAAKQWDKAKEMAIDVILLNANIPDGYVDMGYALYGEGKINEAIVFLKMSYQFPPCRSFPINPTKYTLSPMEILAFCYVELGRLDKARKCAEYILTKVRNNLGMLEVLRICNRADKEIKLMDGIISLQEAISYDKDKVKALLKAIPSFAFDHPTIKALAEKYEEKNVPIPDSIT